MSPRTSTSSEPPSPGVLPQTPAPGAEKCSYHLDEGGLRGDSHGTWGVFYSLSFDLSSGTKHKILSTAAFLKTVWECAFMNDLNKKKFKQVILLSPPNPENMNFASRNWCWKREFVTEAK